MSELQSRQAFLGDPKGKRLSAVRIAVVGLGGGGSQVAKFLAQAGCTSLSLFDHDVAEGVNRNRTDGLTLQDVKLRAPKVEIAKRLLLEHEPGARVLAFPTRWQDATDELRRCDVIVGCVDSFASRRDLEVAAKQQVSPYVDIGLDVHPGGPDDSPQMSGQVLLSAPGGPCLWCVGFLTEKKLALEASNYGGNRGRAQVGWGNGVLAATAAGLVVDIITGWTKTTASAYLLYDGNRGTVMPHPRLQFCPSACTHFSERNVGPSRVRRWMPTREMTP